MQNSTNKRKNKVNKDNSPLPLFNTFSTVFLLIMVIAYPLMMDEKKYTAITQFKLTAFVTITVITSIALLAAFLINIVTTELEYDPSGRKKPFSAPFVADCALLAYWVFMLVSCLSAQDVRLAFYGQSPRNNGFAVQTLYVIIYFIVSRAMVASKYKAHIFMWGGTALAVTCIFHYFGCDLYDVVHYTKRLSDGSPAAAVLSGDYAGPFWNDTKYRFLGPVGNVNLGSYILSVAIIIAAGLYINDAADPFKNKTGRKSLIFKIAALTGFALMLYAELNINTDAGLVALAAAIIIIPPVLCASFKHLCRILHVLTLSAAVVTFNTLLDNALCGIEFGDDEKLLITATVVLAAVTAALELAHRLKAGALDKVSGKNLRLVCCAAAVVMIISGCAVALVITKPDEPAIGSLSGANAVIEVKDAKDKSSTVLHEFGSMLRGDFQDKFGHNRVFTWKRTLKLVRYNPIFGIGPDNFKPYFAKFFHDEAVVQFPSSNGNLDKAHNEFLDILLDNGIVGLISYLTFLGALIYYAFRRVNTRNNGLAPVFGIAVAGYMVHAFFCYQLPIQSPVMWCMLGMTAGLIRMEEKEDNSLKA